MFFCPPDEDSEVVGRSCAVVRRPRFRLAIVNCPSLCSSTSALRFAGHLNTRQDVVTECSTLMPLVSKVCRDARLPSLFARVSECPSRGAGSSCSQQQARPVCDRRRSSVQSQQAAQRQPARKSRRQKVLRRTCPLWARTVICNGFAKCCALLRASSASQLLLPFSITSFFCRVKLVRGHAHDLLSRIMECRDPKRRPRDLHTDSASSCGRPLSPIRPQDGHTLASSTRM